MADPVLKTLEREAERLEADLAADPRYVQLKALQQAIEARKTIANNEAAKAAIAAAAKPAIPASGVMIPAREAITLPRNVVKMLVPEAKTRRGPIIVQRAIEYLRAQRRYMNSSELAEALMAQGVDLSAKSTPAAYLSAFLSNSDLVENIRGHGYGLVEWRDVAGSEGAHQG